MFLFSGLWSALESGRNKMFVRYCSFHGAANEWDNEEPLEHYASIGIEIIPSEHWKVIWRSSKGNKCCPDNRKDKQNGP